MSDKGEPVMTQNKIVDIIYSQRKDYTDKRNSAAMLGWFGKANEWDERIRALNTLLDAIEKENK